jgi:hypothetical protein
MTNGTLEAATEWRRRSEVYTRIRSGSTHTNQGPSEHDKAALKWSEEIPQRNRATKLSANIPDASEARSSARKSCSPASLSSNTKAGAGLVFPEAFLCLTSTQSPSYLANMSGIPGALANRWTWQPSPNNGCRMDIKCRGHGNYVLVTNVPVQEAKLVWHYQGRSGVGTTFQVSGS